jgi:hypothetical protein
MKKTTTITVSIKFRWWFKYYILGIQTMAFLTCREPDGDKLDYWIRKAVIIK